MYSFEELKLLYEWGIISADFVKNAVPVSWITQAQADEILQN
jgi:hypothetical protein